MQRMKRGPRPSTNKPFTNSLVEGRRLADFRAMHNYRHGLPGEMTQLELSLKSGVSRSVISNSEQGNRPMTNRTIGALALALDIDPRQIRMTYQPALELTGAAA